MEERAGQIRDSGKTGNVIKKVELWIGEGFLEFIVMVLNCASEIETKSERIKMVVHADILGIFDVKGDEIQGILEKRFWLESKVREIELVKLGFMKGSFYLLGFCLIFLKLDLLRDNGGSCLT